MSKKVITILLLAVFMLAQFSAASAAQVDGTTALAPLDTFHTLDPVDLDWSVTGMPGTPGAQNVFIWMREQGDAWDGTTAGYCQKVADVQNLTGSNGTYPYTIYFFPIWDQSVVEFLVTVDNAGTCATADLPAIGEEAQASTFIDARYPSVLIANPPSLEPTDFDNLSVACNTFELWGIASDQAFAIEAAAPLGYSGFEGWHPGISGTFAPPAPLGPAYDLLSWVNTFPSTASGNWQFSVRPSDFAGNQHDPFYFRDHVIDDGTKWSDELADCESFSDTSGTDYEVYVRYMAQLDLGHGYLDGTFNSDGTLSRGEMAAFIELANGYDDTTLPPAPPSAACTFSDVSASDWFAGWVWQTCDDGFMIGLGGGLFGPNDTLTRGQVVTVLDNISLFSIPPRDSYLATPNSIFNDEWGNIYREAAWTDVSLGDFFANGVINAYGVGVADGTSETTFSPNQAIKRGEFMKMMYRALSRIESFCSDCN